MKKTQPLFLVWKTTEHTIESRTFIGSSFSHKLNPRTTYRLETKHAQKRLPIANTKTSNVIIDGQALIQAIDKPVDIKTFVKSWTGSLSLSSVISAKIVWESMSHLIGMIHHQRYHSYFTNKWDLTKTSASRQQECTNVSELEAIYWHFWKQTRSRTLFEYGARQAKVTQRNRDVKTFGGFHDRTAAESSLGMNVN